jgi:hypothetical protein
MTKYTPVERKGFPARRYALAGGERNPGYPSAKNVFLIWFANSLQRRKNQHPKALVSCVIN